MIGHWEIRGFGRLILCDRLSARPIGHVGALQLGCDAPVEMTWTLWADADEGLGLAYEAARLPRLGRVEDIWRNRARLDAKCVDLSI